MTPADRRLLAEAGCLVAVFRVALALMRFGRVRRLANRPKGSSTRSALPVFRIVRAVRSAGRYVPGGTKCLPQALAAQALLARYGHPSELCLGVAFGDRGNLRAHAWLVAEGHVVVGGADAVRYQELHRSPAEP